MQIDLKNPDEFTVDALRKLLSSVDDSSDWQLRVTIDGIAYLSRSVGADALEGVLFRFETWDAGNSYVGAAAADDDEWVHRVFAALTKNWPKPTSRYLDYF